LGLPQGFSMSKNVDFGKLRECVTVLNGCLPEVLRRVFVVNTPYVFQAVWGFVSALLDASTADKVRILSKKDWGLIQGFVDVEVLPSEFGGRSEDAYDPSNNTEERIDWGFVPVPDGF